MLAFTFQGGAQQQRFPFNQQRPNMPQGQQMNNMGPTRSTDGTTNGSRSDESTTDGSQAQMGQVQGQMGQQPMGQGQIGQQQMGQGQMSQGQPVQGSDGPSSQSDATRSNGRSSSNGKPESVGWSHAARRYGCAVIWCTNAATTTTAAAATASSKQQQMVGKRTGIQPNPTVLICVMYTLLSKTI